MHQHPLLPLNDRRLVDETFMVLCTIAVGAIVVAAMFFSRAILVPMALAVLLTFILSPMVGRMERRMGRALAVAILAVLVFTGFGVGGWVITRQTVDLVSKLPDYRANIERKIRALGPAEDSPFKRFSQMLVEMESELPAVLQGRLAGPSAASSAEPGLAPAPEAPARVSPAPIDPLGQWRGFVSPFLDGLATTGVVLLLVVFMLLKREDLRARFVKLVGGGRISTTTRAMEEAAERVSRYLIAQLVVNVVFGATLGLGLLAIGVPNAFLWGSLAAVLRFVPYVGVAIASFGPLALALAVSPGWGMLALTILLFAALELATTNALEPLLFQASTGVSALALIGAAIFWAWLWGPMGLILSTPITVCVAVIGKHVRKLSYLSVVLGNEDPLTPSEECYHRLLVGGPGEALPLIELQLKGRSVLMLYDEILIPALSMAERDYERQDLDGPQRDRVAHGVREIVEDLSSRPGAEAGSGSRPPQLPPERKSDLRVGCIPVRAERDEVAARMLEHLLRDSGIGSQLPGLGVGAPALGKWVKEQGFDLVCICVVPPSTVAHARHLGSRIREQCPTVRIVVGLWGGGDYGDRGTADLVSSGVDKVTTSLDASLDYIREIAVEVLGEMPAAPAVPDEAARLLALRSLKAYTVKSDPIFDRMTRDLTRTFDVPIALLTLIDRDRQLFKSQFGLPPELASVCDIPRSASVCSHVVAANSLLVVEDLTRDRRFASNPLLQEHQFRFYAGIPLHAPDGQPIGALCILDTKPRVFTEPERRMLAVMGELMSQEISAHRADELDSPALSVS